MINIVIRGPGSGIRLLAAGCWLLAAGDEDRDSTIRDSTIRDSRIRDSGSVMRD
jgi:hypothetical protein